jgi:hypothetical protein
MHPDHQVFLDALAAKRRVSLRFFSKKERREMTRVCAPLDYGPLRGAAEPTAHYQLWDLEGKRKPLNIAVAAEDVRSITSLDAPFDPAAIITWKFKPKAWHIERDWGELS